MPCFAMDGEIKSYTRRGYRGTKKKPPKDAAQRLFEAARTGANAQGLASAVGASRDLLKLWRDQDPALDEAISKGREKERDALHYALAEAAKAGNITAAIFLLKSRHGYVEGSQADAANRVSINFQVPAAMRLEDFSKVIDITPKDSDEH